MEAPQRVRIGELLVAAQIITASQLEEVLARQKEDGRRLGKLLVEAGLVTETQVTQILSQQLSVPWVSLYHIEFSRQLLDRLPRELAEKYGVIPIFLRRVRGQGETLYIAMDDPSDEAAQQEVSQWCGLPVRSMIAPPADIRAATRAYYVAGKDHASLAEAMAELEAAEGRPRKPPAAAAVPDEGQAVSAPSPAKSKRKIVLTLLDGTEIDLPAASATGSAERPPAEARELGARELLTVLRAVSQEPEAADLAGDKVPWESVFAALLGLLLHKQLIAGWRWAEELPAI